MVIALKENDKVYAAVSANAALVNMSRKDMVLDDNLPIWKIPGHKGWYVMCTKLLPMVDVLRYTDGLFAKEITHQSLIRYTIPRMKEVLGERGLIKEKNWANTALIFSAEKAYVLDAYFCLSELYEMETNGVQFEITRGSLEFTKGLPPKVRLREAFVAVNESRGKDVFPVVCMDAESGKKEIWWSYEDAVSKTQKKTASK